MPRPWSITESVVPLEPGHAKHDRHGGVGRRKFDGVGEQICEHLQQAVGVGSDIDLRFVVDQQHACGFGHQLHTVHRLLDQVGHLDRPEDQRLAPALGALQIENVVDEPHQTVRVAERDAQQICGLVVDLAQNAGGEQAQGAANRGQRRAQLVAHCGHELVLQGDRAHSAG